MIEDERALAPGTDAMGGGDRGLFYLMRIKRFCQIDKQKEIIYTSSIKQD